MVQLVVKNTSQSAKYFLEYAMKLPFVEVHQPQRYNAETEKVIKEAKLGIGLNKAKNTKDLFEKIMR